MIPLMKIGSIVIDTNINNYTINIISIKKNGWMEGVEGVEGLSLDYVRNGKISI